MCAQVHGNNAFGTELPDRRRRNGVGQHTVYKQTPIDIHGEKHPRIRATRSNGVHQRSRFQDNGFASREVGGADRQRNPKLLKGTHLQEFLEEARHPVIAGETEAGNRPPRKIPETHEIGNLFKFLCRDSATVRSPDQRANAGSGNAINGNSVLFEDFEDADVG